MKIMKKLSSSRCKTPELYMFLTRVDEILTRNNSSDEQLLKINEKLKNAAAKLKTAMKNTKVNPFTVSLTRCNKRRRKSYHSFLEFLQSIADSEFDMVKKQAALFLLSHFANYGHKIEHASAVQFSSALNVIFEALATPEALQHIQAVTAEPFVKDLKDAHASFESMYQQKIAFDAQQITPGVKADRDDAGQLVNTMISYLEMGAKEKPGMFGNVPWEINEIVGDLMQQIRARATRNGEHEDQNEGDSQSKQTAS
jgi:hypothetical protein